MDILELLHYTFFRHALLGSLFASIACGIIGTYIVTRRLVFISGGITHPFTFRPPVFVQKIPCGNFSSKKRSGIAVRVE